MTRPSLIGVIHETWKSRSMFNERGSRGIQGARKKMRAQMILCQQKKYSHSHVLTHKNAVVYKVFQEYVCFTNTIY